MPMTARDAARLDAWLTRTPPECTCIDDHDHDDCPGCDCCQPYDDDGREASRDDY